MDTFRLIRWLVDTLAYVISCWDAVRDAAKRCHADHLCDAPHGLTQIRLLEIKDGVPRAKTLYDLESVLGTLRYVQGYTSPIVVPTDRDPVLFVVRFLKGARFVTALVRCPPSELLSTLRRVETFVPMTRFLVVFLNAVNVTRHVNPVMHTFCNANSVRVIDVLTWLVADNKISRADVCRLATREGLMELSFVDRDMDEIEFLGNNQAVHVPGFSEADAAGHAKVA
jgi:hypothetical protein